MSARTLNNNCGISESKSFTGSSSTVEAMTSISDDCIHFCASLHEIMPCSIILISESDMFELPLVSSVDGSEYWPVKGTSRSATLKH